jgi:DNA-binding NtrC family response regulator
MASDSRRSASSSFSSQPQSFVPQVLVIDDLLGRTVTASSNPERSAFCGAYLLADITGDRGESLSQTVKEPIAQAVFCRGQRPVCASVGDVVENNLADVLEQVKRRWSDTREPCWSLVLLDLSFKTGVVQNDTAPVGVPIGRAEDSDPRRYFGLQVLTELRSSFPDLPVLVLSANRRDEVSLKLAEHGVVGFLEKGSPSAADGLAKMLEKHGLIQDDAPLSEPKRIIGQSLPLLRAMRTARRAAMSRKNVLVRGENGTGKELLADYVRRKTPSTRRRRPFEVVNSARLTPELYQSELFGYKKGSWQDAVEDRIGALKRVEGGDLFLDEIGELHQQVQAGLLRLLEAREYSPYGAVEETVQLKDVRFLSATNADLRLMIGRGEFREDLYHRLREFGEEIYLPPLRERSGDIETLAEHFVRRFESELAARARTITPEAMDVLLRYEWPGNIRELRNCLYAAVCRFDDAEYLTPSHLPEYLLDGLPDKGSQSRPTISGTKGPDSLKDRSAVSLARQLRRTLDAFLLDADDHP